jgi:hypothetical protein
VIRAFAIVRVLLLQRTKSNEFSVLQKQRGVDELSETLHNLTSLLLTNKTIRKRSKAVPNTEFFNNKQSISVGV